MSRLSILLLLLIPAIVFSTELVINGDFEDTTGTGWDTVQSIIYNMDISLHFSKDYDTDDDYECALDMSGNYTASVRLFQTVDVQNKDLMFLNFSMNARLSTYGAEGWSVASIIISYLDSGEKRLGDTKIYVFSSDMCPITEDSIAWLHEPNQSIYKAQDTLSWYNYSFNVFEELQKIGTIDPLDVGKIKITAIDTCGAVG